MSKGRRDRRHSPGEGSAHRPAPIVSVITTRRKTTRQSSAETSSVKNRLDMISSGGDSTISSVVRTAKPTDEPTSIRQSNSRPARIAVNAIMAALKRWR